MTYPYPSLNQVHLIGLIQGQPSVKMDGRRRVTTIGVKTFDEEGETVHRVVVREEMLIQPIFDWLVEGQPVQVIGRLDIDDVGGFVAVPATRGSDFQLLVPPNKSTDMRQQPVIPQPQPPTPHAEVQKRPPAPQVVPPSQPNVPQPDPQQMATHAEPMSSPPTAQVVLEPQSAVSQERHAPIPPTQSAATPSIQQSGQRIAPPGGTQAATQSAQRIVPPETKPLNPVTARGPIPNQFTQPEQQRSSLKALAANARDDEDSGLPPADESESDRSTVAYQPASPASQPVMSQNSRLPPPAGGSRLGPPPHVPATGPRQFTQGPTPTAGLRHESTPRPNAQRPYEQQRPTLASSEADDIPF